jgi:hypothetical protein
VRVFHIGFSAKACAPHRQFCKSLILLDKTGKIGKRQKTAIFW